MLIACNKPSWISSFDVVKIIRTHFHDKVWHSWTLDPLASGLMILWVWKGTKQLTQLIGLNKSYETVIDFSLLTDTRDKNYWDYKEEFEVIQKEKQWNTWIIREWNIIQAPTLESITSLLDSIIYQENKEVLLPLPPFSAKKQNGKRLYKQARKWKQDIQENPMKIYNYTIIDYSFPTLTISFSVGSWTYIRSIGYRLGQKLNLGGALTALKRIGIWEYQLNSIWDVNVAKWNIKGEERSIFYQEISIENIIRQE